MQYDVAQGRLTYDEKANGRSEMMISWTSASGKCFAFRLKNQQIRAEPFEGWMQAVPQEAQDAVFNTFLSHYRKRSPVKHALKTAAVGIAEDGHIFIGMNTEHRGADSYKRDCAEQNMINAMRQSHLVQPGQGLVQVYVMGGVDPASRKASQPALVCPCGNCTDMLAKETRSPQSGVTIFPVNDGTALPPVSDNARYLRDLKQAEGWRTTIDALNPYREVALDREGHNASQIGFDELAGHLPLKAHEAAPRQFRRSLATADTINGRANIPAMSDGVGFPDIARYMQGRIYNTLAAPGRCGGNGEFGALATLDARKDYVSRHIESVQVAIIRVRSGEYHTAVTVKGDFDRASAHALERAALDTQEANEPITDVWYMEFNPRAVKEGWMPTPTKESIERAIKRGDSKQEIQFHILPFMRLGLGRDKLAPYVANYPAHELLTGYFTGNGVAKTLPDAREVKEAISEHVQSLASDKERDR